MFVDYFPVWLAITDAIKVCEWAISGQGEKETEKGWEWIESNVTIEVLKHAHTRTLSNYNIVDLLNGIGKDVHMNSIKTYI